MAMWAKLGKANNVELVKSKRVVWRHASCDEDPTDSSLRVS